VSDDPEDDPQSSDSTGEVRCSFVTGDFLGFQYCFICCPTGFFVSEEVGIEPRTVVTYVLAVRCSKIFFDVNVFWFFGQISVIRILIYNLMAIFFEVTLVSFVEMLSRLRLLSPFFAVAVANADPFQINKYNVN